MDSKKQKLLEQLVKLKSQKRISVKDKLQIQKLQQQLDKTKYD